MNSLMKKHFVNPQNMGKIKNPTHFVKYKSGFCGDTIELYVLVENDVVVDVKYHVFGCYAIISAASILSEWAIGKAVDEVKSVKLQDVVTLMGGDVDPEKYNCVSVAVKAFTTFIDNPK